MTCLALAAYIEVAEPALTVRSYESLRTELGSEPLVTTTEAAIAQDSTSPHRGQMPNDYHQGAQAPPVAPGPSTSIDGTVGGGSAAGTATGTSSAKVVQFVYFVEQGEDVADEAVGLIERQAIALQQFWFDQFGGTFVVADTVEVIYGDHPANWYDTTPSGDDPRWYRLLNLRDETRFKLGLAPDDTSVRIVVYPNARIDGRVGANRYGGAWMDGDDIACVSGAVASTPYSPDYPANCLTTVAHELGHVFGLSHQGPDEDCMQFGFYQYIAETETCQFSADNRAVVSNDPFNDGWLNARPGDRA